MKVVSALVVVFALLIALVPTSGEIYDCPKQDQCFTTKTFNLDPDPEGSVQCEDECAVWTCIRDGVGYGGVGCKGDSNICKDDQVKLDFQVGSKCWTTAGNRDYLKKEHEKCVEKLKKDITSAADKCNPNGTPDPNKGGGTSDSNKDGGSPGSNNNGNGNYNSSKFTTTTSKDGTKIGALTIGGMMTLAWMVARF